MRVARRRYRLARWEVQRHLRNDSVAVTPEARDVPRRRSVVSERIAQQLDALRDRLGADHYTLPRGARQLIVGHDVRRGIKERAQDIERQPGEVNLGAPAPHAPTADVDREVGDPVAR
jgi:hypothetical protein